jgi:uncharacterized protein YndB with AHSA1/START domain
MDKMQFSIEIQAPPEKVWETMLGEETYKQWTSAFAADSQVITDWKEGSKAVFGDGKGSGMLSRIEKNVPNRFLSIKHLGMIKNGVEDTESEEVKSWAGALENYTLEEVNGSTTLRIEMDISEPFKDYFTETWPKALAKLKEISESASS